MGQFLVRFSSGQRMDCVFCSKCSVPLLVLPILLLLLTADDCGAFPRPNSELAPLTSNGFRGVKSGAPWGLKLDALPPIQTAENSNGDLNKAVKEILSRNKSPSLRLLLNDKLFLHHLELLLDKPSKKHKQQLMERFLTLRRTDEVSSRFFLRD